MTYSPLEGFCDIRYCGPGAQQQSTSGVPCAMRSCRRSKVKSPPFEYTAPTLPMSSAYIASAAV